MNRHPIRRRVLQVLGLSTALAMTGVMVIGFAHTEHGRPLLRYIPGMGPCPLDAAPLTAADRMRIRNEVLAPLAGEHAAGSRHALAFELGRTTAADVSAWASVHEISCAPARKLALRCTLVPAQSIGRSTGFDEVSFDFDMDGRLVMVDASASLDDAARATDFVAARDIDLRDNLGPPTSSLGAARAEAVTNGPLSQISREFRRSDVRARVVATNSGQGRFTIREFHQLTAG